MTTKPTTKETRQFHSTIESAQADGWIYTYEGGRAADGFKGRIYGQERGNHRIWRCFVRNPNCKIPATAITPPLDK